MAEASLTENERKLLRAIGKTERLSGAIGVDLKPCGDRAGLSEAVTFETANSLVQKRYIDPFPKAVWMTTMRQPARDFLHADEQVRWNEMARDFLVAIAQAVNLSIYKTVEVYPIGRDEGFADAETDELVRHHCFDLRNLTLQVTDGPHKSVTLTDEGRELALREIASLGLKSSAGGVRRLIDGIRNGPIANQVAAGLIVAAILFAIGFPLYRYWHIDLINPSNSGPFKSDSSGSGATSDPSSQPASTAASRTATTGP